MYRVWYSTEGFADYIIEHTNLKNFSPVKNRIYESDANNPNSFYTMPDHIRKILYLDAPDLIVEKNNEPIFTIEITKEAGTGHNAFQRFARIAASVENSVPAFYIYPEAVIITRREGGARWDKINPLIFKALEATMNVYNIPALLFYFPSDFSKCPNNPTSSLNLEKKGLCYDKNTRYADCPDSKSESMKSLFCVLNEVIKLIERYDVIGGRERLSSNLLVRLHKDFMSNEFHNKAQMDTNAMSPLSATSKVQTNRILTYLKRYISSDYTIGELLRNREYSIVYQVNAKFRGDPYPGAISAIDYLLCREGKTFEERKYNLILIFGNFIEKEDGTIEIVDEHGSTIKDFFKDVKSSSRFNLLTKKYNELTSKDIPRYMMQVRYGSTFSKVKHIRVYSYFADAILFPDGALWRDS